MIAVPGRDMEVSPFNLILVHRLGCRRGDLVQSLANFIAGSLQEALQLWMLVKLGCYFCTRPALSVKHWGS